MLVDPNTGDERPFTFDYSFWSHDGFVVDDNGINVPTSPKYADQNTVYEALGKQVLDNAWEGYNCCLFAYGQTGAGKSYSMVRSRKKRRWRDVSELKGLRVNYGCFRLGTAPTWALCPSRATRFSSGSAACRKTTTSSWCPTR